ncbi:MAG: ESPR domain-containing protein [Megasphaera elsdenii]|nr:ESPR domain-containing protein [Megasphaera elsdenii]
MNKTYKVIYNRTRCMYQVVSELAKGRTKSETPEMLKTVFSKHGSLTRGIVMAVLSMSLAMPVGVAVQAEEGSGNTGSGDTTYISDTNTEAQNIQALDKQVVKNAQDIAANKTTTTTNTNNIVANKTAIDKNTANIATNTNNIAANKTAIDKNTASIATNTNNIAANTRAISNEITARTQAIRDLETKLTTGDNSLASKANVDASNIGTKIDTSSKTTDEAKKKKQEDNAKLWGEALGIGTIADGNEELLTGGTLYTELRPPENGFYIYNGQSTAYNLLALDSAVNALGVEKITDNSGNITYVSNLYKYFKANTTPSM